MSKENTIVIWTGCHAPRDRHQLNHCDEILTAALKRMCAKHKWPINVKEEARLPFKIKTLEGA